MGLKRRIYCAFSEFSHSEPIEYTEFYYLCTDYILLTMKLLKKVLYCAIATLCFASCGQTNSPTHDLTQYVNPYIGTGGHGHVFLGANVPFGFVQLGPTEPTRGWDWCSGYHYSDSVLVGFGHTHLSGTGIGDLGDIALLPMSRADQDSVSFSHKNETVTPGYYVLQLQDPNVKVELTATTRAGFHRYTFAQGSDAFFKLDLKQGIGWDHVKDCKFTQESETIITGYRHSEGWAKDQQIFFAAEFSQPVKQVAGDDSVSVWQLAATDSPVLVKVGLSAVSVENAKANLKAEIPAWDFDGTVTAARKAWNDELGKILIETSDETQRRIFYTALFHSMTAPSTFSDCNGDYRGADGKVHKGDFTNYTTLSLWDTYRAAMPLMTLIHPEKMKDMGRTFTQIYKEQGKLPIWHLVGNETDCMVGNPGIIVLADLVFKGFVENKEAAFQPMKASAMLDERGMNLWKQYGYLPCELDPTFETVAKGLEYAIADDGIAKVAKLLGHEDDYNYFHNRSQLYRKHFDPGTGFMRGLTAEGKFRVPFDPFHAVHRQHDYTEANDWQYAWLVPHDVHGLVDCFGSEERFVSKLDSLFIVTGDMGAEASPDISGLIGQYAHGNEPSHHIIYMYNYIGQPWKAADLLRQTLLTMYKDDYDGLSGNEDVGQMSAWYILTSLGLYQVEPSGGKFVFGSPIFDKATLQVGNGKTLVIEAQGNSSTNKYIQQVTFNGKPYTKSYIDFKELQEGGDLVFTMGDKPSDFGTAKEDRP